MLLHVLHQADRLPESRKNHHGVFGLVRSEQRFHRIHLMLYVRVCRLWKLVVLNNFLSLFDEFYTFIFLYTHLSRVGVWIGYFGYPHTLDVRSWGSDGTRL